ncbi:hypothetical protein ES705_48965 [subsurface metagenome]
MNQLVQPQEQNQTYIAQFAITFSGVITTLITVGIICYFIADVLKGAFEVKKAVKEIKGAERK